MKTGWNPHTVFVQIRFFAVQNGLTTHNDIMHEMVRFYTTPKRRRHGGVSRLDTACGTVILVHDSGEAPKPPPPREPGQVELATLWRRISRRGWRSRYVLK